MPTANTSEMPPLMEGTYITLKWLFNTGDTRAVFSLAMGGLDHIQNGVIAYLKPAQLMLVSVA